MTAALPAASRLAPFLLMAAALAGCAPSAPAPAVSAETVAACRRRADEVYERQNRADVFRADSQAGGSRDAAFSGSGAPGSEARAALSAQVARQRLYDSCIRGAAGHVGATPDAPQPAGTPPPRRP